MKKKKFKNKILALVLAGLLCITGAVPAVSVSATEVVSGEDISVGENTEVVVNEDGSITVTSTETEDVTEPEEGIMLLTSEADVPAEEEETSEEKVIADEEELIAEDENTSGEEVAAEDENTSENNENETETAENTEAETEEEPVVEAESNAEETETEIVEEASTLSAEAQTVQDLINALPLADDLDIETMTDEDLSSIQAALEEIDTQATALSAEDYAALDWTNYSSLTALLSGLATTTVLSAEVQAVQDLIDALPDVEDLDTENLTEEDIEAIEALLDEIDEAKLALTDDERDLLDWTKYDAICELLYGSGGIMALADYVAMVEIVGQELYFETINEAFEEANINEFTDSTITLLADVATSETLTVSTSVFLELNGHSLTAEDGSIAFDSANFKATHSIIYINEGAKLTLDDNSENNSGYIGGNDTSASGNQNKKYYVYWRGGAIYNAGTFIMNGGTISDNGSYRGGGVYSTGDMILNGGTISNNSAVDYQGSAIYSGGTGSSLTINGGTICENYQSVLIDSYNSVTGGAVLVSGNFTMNGGCISNNDGNGLCCYYASSTSPSRAVMNGGTISNNGSVGVYLFDYYCFGSWNTFTLNEGEISGNQDGGVTVGQGACFEMNGGTISNNKENGSGGGGVYVGCRFIMNGGEITNNTATTGGGIYFSGGGIYFCSSSLSSLEPGPGLQINGGTISGNSAENGGGICIELYYPIKVALCEINSGIISENSATNGGGVYIGEKSFFNVNYGVISENTATNGGGVYTESGYNYTLNSSFYGWQRDEETGEEYEGWDDYEETGSVSDGTLTITDGTIADNSADVGGGVYAAGTVTMTGGEIVSNTATTGGGVYLTPDGDADYSSSGSLEEGYIEEILYIYTGGALVVSDSPYISGNIGGNVYLPTGCYITLAGQPSSGAFIGVTTKEQPSEETGVLFTREVEEIGGSNYAMWFATNEDGSTKYSYFFSDQQFSIREGDGSFLELYYAPLTSAEEYEMPFTGGSGTYILLTSGLMLALAGAYLTNKNLRKRNMA